MADGELPLNTPVAAELPVTSSPAPAASPVATPEAAASPAPITPPVGDATIPAEAPAPVPEAHKETETVLGEALKPVEAKAPEAPKVEGDVTSPDDAKAEGQSDDPAPPPTFEPFVLSDEVKLDQERIGEFTNLLGEFETGSKADHAKVQEFGQKLMDMYVTETKRAVEEVNSFYATSWERQKNDWKDKVMADPELGGNRFETTINSALSFIRTHGGNEAEQNEFREMLNTSGLGNHPSMVRILARAGKAMSEGTPLAATKAAPNAPKSKLTAMYGKAS